MRFLIPLLLLSVTLAGCTQGDDAASNFEGSCPAWVQSPGSPGGTVSSTFNETFEANLEGVMVHRPTLIETPWDWDGAILDVYEWKLLAGAVDGRYIIKVYAASQDIRPIEGSGEAGEVEWDEKDRLNRLAFRDLTRPDGQQLLSQIVVEPGESGVINNKTYRIELASADETPRPSSIWIEYVFEPNLDNDIQTRSDGFFKTTLGIFYRAKHCV